MAFSTLNSFHSSNYKKKITKSIPFQITPIPFNDNNDQVNLSGLTPSYRNGTYTVTYSGQYNPDSYSAKNVFKGAIWLTNSKYAASVSTNISGQSITGQYIQLQTPYPYTFSNYSLGNIIKSTPYIDSCMTSWYIVGSNDGSSWTVVDRKILSTNFWTSQSSTTPDSKFTTSIVNTIPYSYYRIIQTANAGGEYAVIGPINLASS